MTLDYGSGVLGGIITVSGEIDHHAAVGAIERIDKLLNEHQPGAVTIDLGGVTFMDSSGIALILFANKKQRQIDGSLDIVNVPPQPLRVLSSAGLDKMIKNGKRGTAYEKIRQGQA